MIHPESVLLFLDSLLEVNGYIIIQTPNAVSITKRIKMIFGFHPFAEYTIGGEIGSHHFREYTKSELYKYSKNVGFEIVGHRFQKYFPSSSWIIEIFYLVFGIIPSFRSAQTMILKKEYKRQVNPTA